MLASLNGLQKVADFVCAFCIIFGFDIRGDKLRAFFLQWGHEQERVETPTLLLRHQIWDAAHEEVILLRTHGSFKYVGIQHNDIDDTQFAEVKCKLERDLQYFRVARFAIEPKVTACSLGVDSVVLYRSTLATWKRQMV